MLRSDITVGGNVLLITDLYPFLDETAEPLTIAGSYNISVIYPSQLAGGVGEGMVRVGAMRLSLDETRKLIGSLETAIALVEGGGLDQREVDEVRKAGYKVEQDVNGRWIARDWMGLLLDEDRHFQTEREAWDRCIDHWNGRGVG